MPINKAVLAAFKAASRLKRPAAEAYRTTRALEDVSARITGVPTPRVRVEEKHALMPDGHALPLRIYTPLDLDFSFSEGLTRTEGSRGTVAFFHGGGWVSGDVPFYDDACRLMASRLERRIVSVDYRRAPEHRFPQAPEDCYEVCRQLFAKTLLPDVDPKHVVLFGDSAGGNLAAVTSLMARDRGEFAVPAQILLYPATNNDYSEETSDFDSVRDNGRDYLLTARDMRDYLALYARTPADLDDPYLAPLLEPDLSRQPRTLVITAEYCPLRDEGEAYADRLAAAGNDVACYRMFDAVHGYLLYPSVGGTVHDTYRIIRHFLDGDELSQGDEPSWQRLRGTD